MTKDEKILFTDFVQDNRFELNSYLSYLFDQYDYFVRKLLKKEHPNK